MGQAYAERGVLFSLSRQTKNRGVQQILLAPIDPQSFLLRAEANLHSQYVQSLADLDYVLKSNPDHAHAHWLRARLLIDLGRYPKALADAQAAVRQDDQNAEFRITLATVLSRVSQTQEALNEAQRAVELAVDGTVERTAALACRAEVLLYAPEQNYRLSAQLHQQAIVIADALVDDPNPATRRRVLEVLLKSHLALARDIAWGSWQSKITAVPQWLEQRRPLRSELNSVMREKGTRNSWSHAKPWRLMWAYKDSSILRRGPKPRCGPAAIRFIGT